MTTKEKLIQMCVERGMFEKQAQSIVESVIPEIEKSGRITWNRPAEEYPDVMYATMFLFVKNKVIEWIDTNAPKVWFRPFFE